MLPACERAELGFRIEIFALADYCGEMAKLQATLRARAIRGVLLGFSREEEPNTIFDCAEFCVAGLSGYFTEVVVDRANFHGFFNVQLALDQMYRHGYSRPTLIAPALNNRISNNLWSAAFLDWQRRLPKKDRCEPFIPRENVGAAEFSDWLYRNEPDSLLVYKFPVRSLLQMRGIRVPEEILNGSKTMLIEARSNWCAVTIRIERFARSHCSTQFPNLELQIPQILHRSSPIRLQV